MKTLLILLFLGLFLSIFSQEKRCQSILTFNLGDNNELNIVIVDNGEISRTRNIISFRSLYYRITSSSTVKSKTIPLNNIDFSYIHTKSNITYCAESFIKQVEDFVSSDAISTKILTKKGIPFFSLTKTE